VRIVIDASIALKWVIPEPDSDAANALRADELIAPTLWLVEAANVLWRHARLGKITAGEAFELFATLANAPVVSVSMDAHIERALTIAAEIDHPVYDCLYLAVAVHHGIHVMTADRRFAAAALSAYPGQVRLLAAE
jgi:predicted nucleic acid-binding protein